MPPAARDLIPPPGRSRGTSHCAGARRAARPACRPAGQCECAPAATAARCACSPAAGKHARWARPVKAKSHSRDGRHDQGARRRADRPDPGRRPPRQAARQRRSHRHWRRPRPRERALRSARRCLPGWRPARRRLPVRRQRQSQRLARKVATAMRWCARARARSLRHRALDRRSAARNRRDEWEGRQGLRMPKRCRSLPGPDLPPRRGHWRC